MDQKSSALSEFAEKERCTILDVFLPFRKCDPPGDIGWPVRTTNSSSACVHRSYTFDACEVKSPSSSLLFHSLLTSTFDMSRLDFLKQKAPENYVAGLGRGATGFTTRSDLGPAREGPSNEQIQEALAKRAAALGAAAPTAYGVPAKKTEPEEDEDDGRYQDPDNETGLFAHGMFDRDDDEADRIYQDVDEKMDRRRKQRRSVLSTPVFHQDMLNRLPT